MNMDVTVCASVLQTALKTELNESGGYLLIMDSNCVEFCHYVGSRVSDILTQKCQVTGRIEGRWRATFVKLRIYSG